MIVPETWKKCNISDVMIVERGASPRPIKEYLTNLKDGVNWIKIGDADKDEKYIYSTHEKIKKEGVLKSRFVHNGDLLLSNSMSFGRPYILKTSGCIHDGWLVLHLKSQQLSVDFFYYQLLSQSVYLQFSNLAAGAVVKNLNSDAVKHVEIVVPPLAEQGRIVAKIEELFAGIDAGVENLKSVKNQIALYRQSVLKSAFDGTLYKTTEWNIDVLKNLCSVISDGDHQPPPKAKNGIPFIMISNINKNLINFEDTNFVSENYYTSLSEKRKPKRGDVLYSVVGSYGIPVLVDFQKEFCFQRHIALLRPNTNKIFSKFLFYMLRSRNVYNQATDCSTGTAQKTVPLSGLREIHIPVPTLAEQERIIAEIESRFERADALETAVDRALNDAEKLKQAVLKKAFSGELVPQNPDDEPASVLLDRIRAARASELPAKKGKRKKTEVDSQL